MCNCCFGNTPCSCKCHLDNRKNKVAMDHDPVNHPNHYTDGRIEVIEFIEDKRFGYHLGNAVKYICRAGKKDPSKTIEDLYKARWYLDRHIDNMKIEIVKPPEPKKSEA